MSAYIEQAQVLKNIFQLNREIVAVKFLKEEDISDIYKDYDYSTKMRYCQALMLAGQGRKIILSSSNISCAAASAAFGFSSLHPKLASGEGHFNSGIFGSAESAAKIMSEMPRFELDNYHSVVLAPLTEADWTPDLIVIESDPETIMWLNLALIFHTGNRIQSSTSVIQATCVDATVVPMLTGKSNSSFGCTGCREASDLTSMEAIIGIPFKDLDALIENVKILSENVIPKNRKKFLYSKFTEKIAD